MQHDKASHIRCCRFCRELLELFSELRCGGNCPRRLLEPGSYPWRMATVQQEKRPFSRKEATRLMGVLADAKNCLVNKICGRFPAPGACRESGREPVR